MIDQVRAWAQARLTRITEFYAFESTDEAHARILSAIVDYYGFDPTDDIQMTEPQELTDAVMKALFRR